MATAEPDVDIKDRVHDITTQSKKKSYYMTSEELILQGGNSQGQVF